ncbi:MAG: hypothetical protein AAF997_04660 [Myxococcota bacterium]
MQRLAFTVISGLLIAGCPGNLSNPEDFIDGGGPGGGGGVIGPTVEEVLEVNCGNSVCHDADAPAAALDLVSPNVEARTIDIPSSDASCSSELLVVIGNPDESYLLAKILNSPGICGGQMPIGTILPAEETEVIRQWILDLGGVAPGIDDGVNDPI